VDRSGIGVDRRGIDVDSGHKCRPFKQMNRPEFISNIYAMRTDSQTGISFKHLCRQYILTDSQAGIQVMFGRTLFKRQPGQMVRFGRTLFKRQTFLAR